MARLINLEPKAMWGSPCRTVDGKERDPTEREERGERKGLVCGAGDFIRVFQRLGDALWRFLVRYWSL